jgi:hypothetical protein
MSELRGRRPGARGQRDWTRPRRPRLGLDVRFIAPALGAIIQAEWAQSTRSHWQVRSAWARGACHWQPGTVSVLAAARRAGGPRPWTRSPEGRWSPGHNPAVAGRLRTHSGGDQSTHTIGTAGTKSGRLPVVKPV